ncbi:MAG: phosphate ABC transporter permease, partial [Thermodesulfobacteriota bacterium]|nr:phosphate ABC transporter permease [Thermodesulfobacteriota bacterium]
MSRSLEITITVCSWLCGIVLLGAVSTVIGYLLFKGFGTLGPQLLFGSVNPLEALLLKKQVFDGLFPAVVGTLLLVILSVGIAIPIGMTSGVYMAEYANGSVKKIFSLLFDILASIPSIVVGLFGFSLAVFLHRHFSENIYPSLLISSL